MSATEVLCLGEALAVITVAGDLSSATPPPVHVGGAEANVAQHLAAQGIAAAWTSRVGDDPFGRLVLATLSRAGVDVSGVTVDPTHPTGMYVKEARPDGTSVMHYYRSGSAASAMDASDLERLPLDGIRWVHVSGITPAISSGAADLVDALIDAAHARGVRVSFDVNHRPRLWADLDTAADHLLATAQRADLVLVGRDEAESLWGTTTADDVFAVLDRPPLVVVKDGEIEAVELDRATGRRTAVPTPIAAMVEPVGAGDAFAGGYLAGLLRGEDASARLARGHACAGWTIGGPEDVRPGHHPLAFIPS
ncbi:sugar kinase [Microbacterium sp. HMH0099]|uniref:sugar kinase n=1 Tax=Microbacterium sp. HMH0099 TaxID=3414026 RepID=UPI003BF69956